MDSSVLSPDAAISDPRATPVLSREDGRTVVWLDGEHDISTLLFLTTTLAGVIAADDADLVVDLSAVTFIGTASFDELIRGRMILRQQSRTLTLRSPSRCARRLLDACGFSDLIEP